MKLVWNLYNLRLVIGTVSKSACHIAELEQLKRLRAEDNPRRLMITHTGKSYWFPSQKKTSKLQIKIIRQNFKTLNFATNITPDTHSEVAR